MRNVVGELSELCVLRANVLIEAGSDGGLLGVVPVRITIRAGSMIATDDVIRVCDPNTGWSLVSVEQTPRAADVDNEIVFNQILCLSGVLNENSVTHSMVGHVILHAQIMDSVDSDSTVEGVMDSVIADV